MSYKTIADNPAYRAEKEYGKFIYTNNVSDSKET